VEIVGVLLLSCFNKENTALWFFTCAFSPFPHCLEAGFLPLYGLEMFSVMGD
jgi:hypothetical protein